MSAPIVRSALGITPPWLITGVDFDEAEKLLSIEID